MEQQNPPSSPIMEQQNPPSPPINQQLAPALLTDKSTTCTRPPHR
ncbi:MAG: hypothetical protein RIG66_23835 [Coleofasciculus sp. E2-BRE-01]